DRKPAVVVPLRLDRTTTFLGNFSYNALARLKPGVTIQQANADVARLIPLAIQRFPPYPGYSAKMFQEARLAPALRSLNLTCDAVSDLCTYVWKTTPSICH